MVQQFRPLLLSEFSAGYTTSIALTDSHTVLSGVLKARNQDIFNEKTHCTRSRVHGKLNCPKAEKKLYHLKWFSSKYS